MAEELGVVFGSPSYEAVSGCRPNGSETDNTARPAASVAAPRVVDPSRNVTLPVAVPGVTVAVRLTFCPTSRGLAWDVRDVLDVARLTVWARGGGE